MEPDLDRLLDFESRGTLFPQYKDSWDEVFGLAQKLRDKLCAPAGGRIRVAIRTADPLAFSALFLAFARSEVDLYFFNPGWGRSEQEVAQRLARPRAFIGDLAKSGFQCEERTDVPQETATVSGQNRLRVMIPTGGTSGEVRFAIHNWSSLASATYGFQQHVNCVHMAAHCVLPLYHVSGFMQLIRALLTMGSIVYGHLGTFAERHQLLERVQAEGRFLSLVATQLERLVRAEENHALLRQYRAVFVGGGPTRVGLMEDCRELKIPLAPTYGMTETAAQVATLLPELFLQGETSQGRALPHARIDLVDEEIQRAPVAAGQVGRIRIGGPSLFLGYVGEAAPMKERLIVTSDLGVFDQGGNLTVLGRADRVIITGGEKINLREVELAAERTNLLRDVIAFGVEDMEWGEKLALAYVPKEDLISEDALREAMAAELAFYKVPKTWIRRAELPRSEAGKPRLRDLRDAVES